MPDASINDKTPRKGRFSWSSLFTGLGLLAFLLAWLAPNHYPPWLTFHSESLVFAALIAFSSALLLRVRPLRFDGIVWLVWLLVGLVWLQWCAGLIGYRGDAAVSSLYLFGFALAWLLGLNAATVPALGEKMESLVAGVMVLAAALSVYAALAQWLDQETNFAGLVLAATPGMRPYGNLAQPNQLASLILIAVVMALWLHRLGKLKTWQTWALVVWLSWGLTMVESRSGWLSACLLGVLVLWRGQPAWLAVGWRTVAGWWLMLLVMRTIWTSLQSVLLLAPPIRPLQAMAQDNGRLVLWRQLLAGIEQAPWFGYGWRQTVAGHKAGTAQLSSGALTDYSHSLVLDLILWLGLPLAILLLGLMGWWLLRATLRVNTARQLLLLAAALPIMVHSLVEFPFAYAYFLFLAGWLLGGLAALQLGAGSVVWSAERWLVKLAWLISVLAFAGVSTWAGREYLDIEEDYRVMRFELRNVGTIPQGYEVPRPVLLDHLGAILRVGRIKPHTGMSAEELEGMRQLNRNYNWATLQVNYALALALNGQAEQAEAEMESLRQHFGEESYKQAVQFIRDYQRQHPELEF